MFSIFIYLVLVVVGGAVFGAAVSSTESSLILFLVSGLLIGIGGSALWYKVHPESRH
jgi:hypothetical protein